MKTYLDFVDKKPNLFEKKSYDPFHLDSDQILKKSFEFKYEPSLPLIKKDLFEIKPYDPFHLDSDRILKKGIEFKYEPSLPLIKKGIEFKYEPILPLIKKDLFEVKPYEPLRLNSDRIFKSSYESKFGVPVIDNYGMQLGRLHASGLGYDVRDTMGGYVGHVRFGESNKSMMKTDFFERKSFDLFRLDSDRLFKSNYESKFGVAIVDNYGSQIGRLHSSGMGYDLRDNMGGYVGHIQFGGSGIPGIK